MVTFDHELLSETGSMKSLIFRVSRQNFDWQFESGFMSEDGTCSALFSGTTPDKQRKCHLHATVTPNRESYHYSVT